MMSLLEMEKLIRIMEIRIKMLVQEKLIRVVNSFTVLEMMWHMIRNKC